MLELLHIENIAIIERADILFGRGFNALTGETGAGKSIVIDALGAVLGQRTSRELIRTGAEKAFVSAIFSGVPELPWFGTRRKRLYAGGGRNAFIAARAVRRRQKRLPRGRTAGDGRAAQAYRRELAQYPRPARRTAVTRRRAAPCLPRPLWPRGK